MWIWRSARTASVPAQLGQALHARLRLLGLARLGLEAIDERLQVRALDLFLLERDLLQVQLLGALVLEARCSRRCRASRVPSCRCRCACVTPSRNSRSCEIISSVPGYFSSHCSSQSTASRSRWLVGSSSSSRSDGIISARARLRRTRQPPEKSDTGMRCVSERKAQAVQQPAGARFGVVAVDVGQLLVRDRRPRPSPRQSIAAASASRIACTSVSPDTTKSIAASGSDGVSCATLAMRSARGQIEIALVGLDLALDRREQAGLAAAVATDHADARAGVQRRGRRWTAAGVRRAAGRNS